MKLLIIDNYDSFTFNLKHMCQPYVDQVDVIRNDSTLLQKIDDYDKIIISPGPGLPEDSGLCLSIISKYLKHKPILGICLGAQAIALVGGFSLFNLKKVVHGKKTRINILDPTHTIYRGLPNSIMVGRYHSWGIDMNNEKGFLVTATDVSSVVMSFRHLHYPLTGVQFHPESVLTDFGDKILKNWLIFQ